MKKTPEQKAKHNNFMDVVCDEIYAVADEACIGGDNILFLLKKDARKIAKRIAKRWMIGPR